MRLILSLVLSFAAMTSAAEARAQSLAEEADINTGLFNVAVADKIRKECDAIAPRMFAAMSYLRSLNNEARNRGYSDEEIERYVTDDAEKEKMNQRRNAYIIASGAHPADGPSMCELGRKEIARQSQIGQLLRAR